MSSPQRADSATTTARSRPMLRDTVYEDLYNWLVAGHFAAGESLSIDNLAQQLTVSPTPVREALVQLESTGLVIRTALRGYTIAPPLSAQELDDLFDARELLEVGAAERAASRATELVPTLQRLHREHIEAAKPLELAARSEEVTTDQLGEYFRADWAFHNAIIQAKGNYFVQDMAGRISTHAQRRRQFSDCSRSDVAHAVAEHHAILRAFETGDADQIASAMREHIRSVRARARADLPSQPEE